MKNDPMFKFLAATVLIGAIVAIVAPTPSVNEPGPIETVHASQLAE